MHDARRAAHRSKRSSVRRACAAGVLGGEHEVRAHVAGGRRARGTSRATRRRTASGRRCRAASGACCRAARASSSSGVRATVERRAEDVGVEAQLLDGADAEAVGGEQAEARPWRRALLRGDLRDRRRLADAGRADEHFDRREVVVARRPAARSCVGERLAEVRQRRAAAPVDRDAPRQRPARAPASSPLACSRAAISSIARSTLGGRPVRSTVCGRSDIRRRPLGRRGDFDDTCRRTSPDPPSPDHHAGGQHEGVRDRGPRARHEGRL